MFTRLLSASQVIPDGGAGSEDGRRDDRKSDPCGSVRPPAGVTPYTITFRFKRTAGWNNVRRETEREFHSPQSEAAIFFGLFLRGHPVDSLREQIDIPPKVFKKWMRLREYDADFQEQLRRTYVYRKQVLVIFDSLVTTSNAQTACH